MKRIWVSVPTEGTLEISGDEHIHLSVVFRAKVGEEIIAISGDNYDRHYTIESMNKKTTILRFIKKQKNQCNPTKPFTVYLSLIKSDMLSLVVQKLNEIGATDLKLFYTEYSQKTTMDTKRIEHLNNVAVQSCKQCGRSIPLKISFTKNFADYHTEVKENNVLFLDNYAGGVPNIKQDINGIIVGCEGGFTEEERKQLEKIATPVSFGDRILRSETAAIVGASKWCI